MSKNYRTEKIEGEGPCCQLRAAVNARIFLGLPDISDEQYDRLIDKVGCRYGAAVAVEKAYPELGLAYNDLPITNLWIHDILRFIFYGYKVGDKRPNFPKSIREFLFDITGKYWFWRHGRMWIRNNLPVELKIYDPEFGFHAILITGFDGYWVNELGCSIEGLTWKELTSLIPNRKWLQRVRTFSLLEDCHD